MTNHLIIDAQMLGRGGDYILDEAERMKDFLRDTVKAMDMRILAGPEIYRGHIDLPGLTGAVIIETSHINIHTFTRTGDIRFDAYSCVLFKADKVIELFDRYYPCEIKEIQGINRMIVLTSDYRVYRKEGA